ncbi:MAG: lactate 2-monooxygenase [Candidatus Didemnitutus sp.]|nr:lactate 2-monooxygenase [Candidatus Didemnitutus sp.]
MSQPHSDIGRARQREVYLAGVGGRRPRVPVASAELEKAAQGVIAPEAFAYIAGGAGREGTMANNRAALDRWQIVPRRLRDCETRDTSVELFGRKLATPLLLAPIGVAEMAHADADLAVARAAARWDVPHIFSNQASVPMEACAAAMGNAPRWFQLYWSKSNDVVASFVRRAEACGCDAIVLTLDTTMLGWRPRDLDLGYLPFLEGKGIAQYTSDPVFMREVREAGVEAAAPKPPLNLQTIATALAQKANFPGGLLKNLASSDPRAAVARFVATYSRSNITWDDLKFLREHTKLPIVLKGILHAEDARLAVQHGADGIIVSNHGGRQIDGEIASIDALPGIVAAVGGKIPVLFDSGVRGGADVFKALALGARAVCLGRPYVYGLALAGEAGVSEVIANVLAEFDLTMGLAGCRSVGEITPAALVRA